MYELVFLGTSASAPSNHRGLSSVALLAGDERYLIDCGEGTQRQILKSGLGFKRLNRILLTHAHLDHILGVGGLVSTYVRWDAMQEVNIWGSSSTLERIHALIYDVVLRHQSVPIPIHLNAVREGVFYEHKHFTLSAFPVRHRGRGCVGYILQERTHRPFLADQASALGVPPSAERARLVRGESVTLSDGRTITPDMVLGTPIAGTKIVFTGDTADTESLRPYVQDADVLVIEATFTHVDRELAQAYGHITATQAAELAQACNVRGLVLNHISRRYSERQILQDARAVFPSVFVARDFDRFRVGRETPLYKLDESEIVRDDDGDLGY